MFSFLATIFSGKLAKTMVAIWTGDGDLIGTATELGAEYFDAKLNDYQEARKAERFFAEIEDEVFESIQAYVESEFRSILPGDVKLSIETALTYVCSKKFLDTCLEHGLRAEVILDVFQKENITKPSELCLDENVFFSLSKHVVAKVLSCIDAFPKFSLEALKAVLADTSEILDRMSRIELLVNDLHHTAVKPKSPNEVIYRTALTNKLGKVNIFGVDTTGLPKRYDLSLAYVNLTITGRETKKTESSIKVISLALKNPRPLTVVTGEPGSGKTTLLSWLLLSMVKKQLPDQLRHLNDFFPVFVRLRDFAGLPFPQGAELVTCSLGAFGAKLDTDWLSDIVKNRKLLFMLDGYDELPEGCRSRASQWVEELLAAWPESKAILSSRPYAVAEVEQLVSEFGTPNRELNVQPMDLDQVGQMISRWYRAYEHQVAHNQENNENDLKLLQARLIKQVFSNRVLRTIVRNPLICSLLCFVNADRKGIVPSDRGELYRIATSALVARRDAERGIEAESGVVLTDRQSTKILCFIAEYFYLRKSFQVKLDDVEGNLKEYLPSLGIEPSKSGDILRYLAERSHVLRSPAVGAIDFSHKTFQEYYYALRIVEKGMVEWVRDNFTNPDYNVVCAFAMSLSTPAFADQLVADLLEKLPSLDEADRRHCLLVLQGSIRDIAELDPELRETVRGHLAEVLPPKNSREADELSGSGAIIVEPLGEFAVEESRQFWPFCIEALIGSMEPDALFALERFAELGDTKVDQLLANGRSLFPNNAYSRVVLANCTTLLAMEIETKEDALVALQLPKVQQLIVKTDLDEDTLQSLACLKSLRHLVIQKKCDLRSLSFLGNSKQIELLELYGAEALPAMEFNKIGLCTSLTKLIVHSGRLETVEFVKSLHHLEFIDLSESLNFTDLSPLRRSNGLRTIKLPYSWMYDQFDFDPDDITMNRLQKEVGSTDDEIFDFIGDIDEFSENELISQRLIDQLVQEDAEYMGFDELDFSV
ncbi:NACHT domain-containing protein [Tropicibacter sp. R15_0]|uniref:NACHT domain-containing protein n=1 Tax=Tropicibacter sp. R15_0 TaxID=2821101 RepID=UPI001ADA9489|nr:NACHT domain-containing protein [Tropicibacter sp. R15_0]MBO9467075.1 NACHT domain-containing protein [Tropicibacter sp. R15_0]